ncbi:hypothetical protein HK103_002872 [Boothiomyces macroporosus]|uniref:Prefoldin subunit 1 n=1 Tax=Boothiomyces macroporosus TaxID=261099 RepID=A0AAD5UCT0_9FUNG|nr:hypothetical protein HK103_002872 [Boothiomyces macroporosus]
MKELVKKEKLNRSEFQLVYKTKQDLKKTIPFFVLMLVLPESLPFLLLSGSRMIPSVCISTEDLEKRNVKIDLKRKELVMAKLFEQYYQEYSAKIQQSRTQLMQIRASLQSRSREQKLTQLTLTELSSSRSDVYKTVGKMFIKEDYDLVLGDLKGKVDLYTRDVLAMEKMALKTDGELKDYERNLESLIKKVSASA